jgi:N6-L-threonylcarbamoyladenine synthase
MKILAIETSCDETGIAILEYRNDTNISTLLGNALASQVDLHAQYGGVFPALAKRAHAEKFVPLLESALSEAGLLVPEAQTLSDEQRTFITDLCTHESVLADALIAFFEKYQKPTVDAIAVTTGPGLEPALWVGINAAKVLASIWQLPLYPINHMEGHVVTALIERKHDNQFSIPEPKLPVLSLLVSGGHTELVFMETLGSYKKIGQTKDDAVGEAFDKVARMLGLSYPGGPAVSKLAATFRASGRTQEITLPRPMLHSKTYDFSYSGIKTAVLYTIRDRTEATGALTPEEKDMVAAAFEDAAIEVLIKKTMAAALEYGAQSIVVGGGVAGNTYLRSELDRAAKAHGIPVTFPEAWLATDNAVMIGLAACLQVARNAAEAAQISLVRANGNLSIENCENL